MQSLPIEQFHSETYLNLHIQNLARERNLKGLDVDIDWTFGPILLHVKMAPYWLEDDGVLWEAQIRPYVRAWKHDKNIGSVMCNFLYQQEVKEDEQGVSSYSAKRLYQLNVLIPKLDEILTNALLTSSSSKV